VTSTGPQAVALAVLDLARAGRFAEIRDVTIRLYPADNHFFFPGTGPSSPAELAAPQHLDPQLAADVGDWLTASALSSGPA
jgi:hypothetical protein